MCTVTLFCNIEDTFVMTAWFFEWQDTHVLPWGYASCFEIMNDIHCEENNNTCSWYEIIWSFSIAPMI